MNDQKDFEACLDATLTLSRGIMTIAIVMSILAWSVIIAAPGLREVLVPLLGVACVNAWIGRRAFTDMPKLVDMYHDSDLSSFRSRIMTIGLMDSTTLAVSILAIARISVALATTR
jgi:hypothetical protein